jgi:hypothetical protein
LPGIPGPALRPAAPLFTALPEEAAFAAAAAVLLLLLLLP